MGPVSPCLFTDFTILQSFPLSYRVASILSELTSWFAINSEAVYGTRPFRVSGEGHASTARRIHPGRDPGRTAAPQKDTFPQDHSISASRICDVSAGRRPCKAAPARNAQQGIPYASGRSSAWMSARKRFPQLEGYRC